jgi:hypothetical protein
MSSYDPFDAAVMTDPYPFYDALRRDDPVAWSEGSQCWVLSRYADVDAALRDEATFVSGQGVFPSRNGGSAGDLLLPMLITMDPPRHTSMRQLVSRGFTPRRIADLEPLIRDLTRQILDAAAEGGGCDAASAIAGPLPAIVIADLLGIPRDDRDQFRAWSSALAQADPSSTETLRPMLAAAAELYGYFAALLPVRRERPGTDLLSVLVAADPDGEPMSDEELLGFCFLLLVAGHETSTNLLSNALALLAREPDQRQLLVDDPSLVPAAVEEVLRYESPVQCLSRSLSRDVTLHGTTMRAGDAVLLLFASANRDERAFPGADRFDVTRQTDQHLAFGRGIHFCLGSALARLEARVVLEELLARFPSYRVDLGCSERVRSGMLRGWQRLPLSWDA